MRGLQTAVEHAQAVKEYLVAHGLLDRNYRLRRTKDSITFPVTREFNVPFEFDADFVDVELDEQEQQQSLKKELEQHLSSSELDALVTSFDTVGSIVIIEIPEELERRKALIGQKVLELNRPVKTVLRKVGGHEGPYRVQRMECIAGEDTRETLVTENGARLKVNVEEAYYSVRMATERKRIASLVNPGERILCLFSGVGPYPVVLSRHTDAKEIVGIEINPAAHELALENVAMNRCTNVHLLEGDAHAVLPKLARAGQRFDRVTMPLPHTSQEFLDDTLAVCAAGAVVHYYSFEHESEFENAVDTVRAAIRRSDRTLVGHNVVKCGQHAPRVWRVCVDAKID